jgi:hypothetical protein
MNEVLRSRIVRKLDTLPDERVYQVLDYIDFLESKYAERSPGAPNVFQRFAEGVEDSLRAGRVSTAAITETMNLMSRAMGILQGVAAAGRSMATDVVAATGKGGPRPSEPAATPPPRPNEPPLAEPPGGAIP